MARAHLATTCAVLLALSAGSVRASVRYQTAWSASQLGDPLHGGCARRHSHPSAVCDASGQLPARFIKRIDAELRLIRDAERKSYARGSCTFTADFPGYLIEVALVRRMAGGGPSKPFAKDVFSRWDVASSRTCGNSALLFISTEDRKFSFVFGPGVRRVLDDVALARVANVVRGHMKNGNLYHAVLKSVVTLGRELADASPRRLRGKDVPVNADGTLRRRQPHSWWFWFVVVVAALTAVGMVSACCNGFGGKDAVRRKKLTRIATKKLRLIKQEYEAAILPQYTPITCSVCQGDLLTQSVSPADDDNFGDAYSSMNVSDLGPVRHLRCGHKFLAACLDKQGTTTGGVTVCPVCSDSSDGARPPPSLAETRDLDLAFRVTNLKLRYPEVISDDVHQQLLAPPPRQSRVPLAADDGDFEPHGRTQGPAWGALAGAAGVGALAGWGIGSMFSGFGFGGNDDRYDGDQNGWGGNYGSAFSGGWGNGNQDAMATSGHWGSAFGGGSDGASAFSGGWGGGGDGGGGNSSFSGGW